MAGLDWIVRHECLVKHRVGGGDASVGARRLLSMLHDHTLAVRMEQRAARDGLHPEEVAEQMRQGTPVGLQDLQVGYAELKERSAALAGFAADCVGCPANAAGQGYGCIGSVGYPIPRWVEKWLLQRLEPPGTFGGDLFLAAFERLPADKVRALRDRGLFQLRDPLERTLQRGWFRKITVDVDRLLHPILGAGPSLSPARCAELLLWFGVLRVDGRLPERRDDLHGLESPEDRSARTSADVGPAHEDPHVRAVQQLFLGMHRAWCLDVPVTVQV